MTPTDADADFVFVDLHCDPLRTKLVNALTFPHEHNLKLRPVGVVVDVLSNPFVNWVFLYWDVDSDSGLEIHDKIFELLNFIFVDVLLLN